MGCVRTGYRAVAVLAVAIMAASGCVAVLSSDGAEADTEDYNRYYYDQLDGLSKEMYGLLIEACDNNADRADKVVDLSLFSSNNAKKMTDELRSKMNGVLNALTLDRPEICWTDSIGFTYSYKPTWADRGTVAGGFDLTMTLDDISERTFGKDVPQLKSDLETAVASVPVKGTSTFDKVKSIHDYLWGTLTYNEEEMNSGDRYVRLDVHSAYTALAGDHNVVCEGYAKAFKVLCDHSGIPCILVSGNADNGSGTGGHMWNYVRMGDGQWYLVDCTWDDPIMTDGSPVPDDRRDTYLLVGSNTVCEGIDIASTYSEDIGKYGLTPPSLSSEKYVYSPHEVNYVNDNGPEVVHSEEYGEGDVVTLKAPSYAGHTFVSMRSEEGTECSEGQTFAMPDRDVTVHTSWDLTKYTATFVADGETVGTDEFTVEDAKLDEPDVPNVDGYENGTWEKYEIGPSDMTVNAVYRPIEYTATFVADGKVVGTDTFTMDDPSINVPDVPNKDGYEGKWEDYSVGPGNIEIDAVYTEAESSPEPLPVAAVGVLAVLALLGVALVVKRLKH